MSDDCFAAVEWMSASTGSKEKKKVARKEMPVVTPCFSSSLSSSLE